MSESTPAVKDQAAAPENVEITATPTEGDYEARLAQLEAEKHKAIEEAANYKLAFLKEKSKKSEVLEDETDEERIRRITREEQSTIKIQEIDREKEELLVRLAKENKELKLAQLNKADGSAAIGSHSEGPKVQDTLITNDQLAAFKARGWSDKDIERYKKNLQRNTR